jgi:hypothetical protein
MENNSDNNLKDLIFEVACLGCGKTVFNLPFIKNTHHTMTCQECGEVTITHILIEGSIALATAEQKKVALFNFQKSFFEKILRFKTYLNYQQFAASFNWTVVQNSIRHKDNDSEVIFEINSRGLVVYADCITQKRPYGVEFQDFKKFEITKLLEFENLKSGSKVS